MLEPRGHADMYGAILTEPVTPGSHAGVLFMHNEGYSTMCGHGIIAVTTIALERGLIMPGQDGGAVVYDSPAGTIRARARWRERQACPPTSAVAPGAKVGEGRRAVAARVESVSFVNVPSFVLHGGLTREAGGRDRFAPTSRSAARSTPSSTARRWACRSMRRICPELRRVGMEIKRRDSSGCDEIAHPLERGLHGIYGTIFTGPPSDEGADLRNVTVFADAEVDRSPCGTGTAAVMAVVDAMGLLADDEAVRARKPDRHAIHRPGVGADRGRRARGDRAGDRRVGAGSPASTRFWWTTTIR